MRTSPIDVKSAIHSRQQPTDHSPRTTITTPKKTTINTMQFTRQAFHSHQSILAHVPLLPIQLPVHPSVALKVVPAWLFKGMSRPLAWVVVWSVSGCSSLSLCLFCLCYMSLDLNLLCIAMFGVLFVFITALLSWMLLQCIEVLCNRTLMMLSPLAPVPITLWGLFFRCYGSFCPVKVVLLAPCELACLWILMALMRHCILGTLSTFSVCPRLVMVLGPVLVCISGSGCIYPSVVESFAWFLYISSPW